MRLRVVAIVVLGALMGACTVTPQPPVPMNFQSSETSKNIALVFAEVPSPNLALPGADCLLCIAAAAAANGGVSKVVKSYSTEDLADIKSLVTRQLESDGYSVVAVDDVEIDKLPKFKADADTGFAKRDFSSLAGQTNAGNVVVVDFTHVGATRPYASYVPTGAPYANVRGLAYAVRSGDNSYSWYEPIEQVLQAEGEWKEEPDYYNLTNAYYRVVEQVRDQILNALTKTQATDTDMGDVESALTDADSTEAVDTLVDEGPVGLEASAPDGEAPE